MTRLDTQRGWALGGRPAVRSLPSHTGFGVRGSHDGAIEWDFPLSIPPSASYARYKSYPVGKP